MFRCRHCGVRMFERDCEGHLRRHGLDVLPKDVLRHHFEKGPCDQAARPGDNVKPAYAPPSRRGRKVGDGSSGGGDDDDNAELN